jgi:hypothetical protein
VHASRSSTPNGSAISAGKQLKVKKRKRQQHLLVDRFDAASNASATPSEAGDEDDYVIRLKRPRKGRKHEDMEDDDDDDNEDEADEEHENENQDGGDFLDMI